MRDERRDSACLHVDRHRQALGYFAPWTYIIKRWDCQNRLLT